MTFSAVAHYLCLAAASLEEELLEPEEQELIQSRKLRAQAGPLMSYFLLNLEARKPKDWGRPEVQTVLWVMEVWAQ